MTQVPLILVHKALRTVPRHSPSGGPVTQHSPPPWLGKLLITYVFEIGHSSCRLGGTGSGCEPYAHLLFGTIVRPVENVAK